MSAGNKQWLWLWPVVMPVMPVLLSIAVLEFVGSIPEFRESILKILNHPTLDTRSGVSALFTHGNDRLMYAGAVVVHLGLCLAAVGYFFRTIIQVGEQARSRIFLVVVSMSVLVLGSMVVLKGDGDGDGLVVYQYTYFMINDVLAKSCEVLAESCRIAWIDPDQVAGLIMLPSAAGVLPY